ncbi:MAG: tetratricopeptide repeat protein, partial [Planctomycetota bacterium]|nr:tetratricopeptide repeat protein [Planctomycetota bacterium]
MQLDGYQRCVGGADKKIKFCCGKDITQDLNAIFSAMGSEQKAAALDTANRAIQKHGEKDCLLATKASVLIQLNEYQQAESLVEKLLEHNPHNPVALGQ